MNTSILQIAETLKSIPDPRSKQGVSHPFSGLLALVLLGLTARQIYISHIVKWAAVDGKTSKQFRQADGEPIHMLNVFVHDLNATLAQYSVKGEKTNEEACLKLHAAELFAQYPFIKLLTGRAA